jgi:exodeoxyribonuclease VII large subunit
MAKSLGLQTEVYTVSELTSQIKLILSNRFREITVEGEVSNAKLYPSGHLYFTLKDETATIKGVVFNYRMRWTGEGTVKDGDRVVCDGRVDVYEKRGEYQLIASTIRPKGDQGILYRRFLELKERLYKEGIFDLERKKPLPLFPERIGIITSPAGAAVRDMLKVIFGKYENMSVLIYPVKVQGEEAPFEIVEAIEYFNQAGEADVIILGRGGGSLEDLAPFNEEIVARAICASKTPIVCGVGHEVDFTIADFAADLRAPTPTAAADMVVRSRSEWADLIALLRDGMVQGMKRRIERARNLLYQGVMELREMRDIFTSQRMYLDELLNNLIHGSATYLRDRRNRLENLKTRLADLHPHNILKRGYSITTRPVTGEVLVDAAQVEEGETLEVRLFHGALGVLVRERKGAT